MGEGAIPVLNTFGNGVAVVGFWGSTLLVALFVSAYYVVKMGSFSVRPDVNT